MSQSTGPGPDANPPAGLLPDDRPTRSRRDQWGARVLAVVACLAWLAWPTGAFAQPTLVVDDVAGDNTINRSEHVNNFAISGNTGTEEGVTVDVTIGGQTLPSVTSAIQPLQTDATWSVTVPSRANYITEPSVALSVTATSGSDSATVTRTLTVDLTAPTVSYAAPMSLTVGAPITIDPTTNDTDIVSYVIDTGPLPQGLSLNGTTGVISGTPTTGSPDAQTVVVLAEDGAGNPVRPQIAFPAVDGPRPGVKTSTSSLSVPEGGSASYTVVLETRPTHDVTITVSWVAGDADLTPSTTTLTFEPADWNKALTVTVSAAEDDDGTASVRVFQHAANSSDPNYEGVRTASVTAREADNDPIGATASRRILEVPEGGSAEYTLVLGSKPDGDVVVEVERMSGSDESLTASPDEFTFTQANWHEEQTVTVSAAEDDDWLHGIATFEHGVSSDDDENYDDDDIVGVFLVTAIEADDEDEINPSVEIRTEASAQVAGPFEVTIRFSEWVKGFQLEDIEVSNGTASNFNKLSPRTYAVTITPEETGEVRVEVGSNVARDRVGNGNDAAEPFIIEADLTGPEVEITSEATGPVSGAFEVTIRFSESVEGFELEDIEVSNGTASNFNKLSPRTYAVTITPEETGEVRVEVGSNVALDAGGYGNEAAEPFVIEADLTGPEVEITSEATGPVSGAFEVTIRFSESVEGFELEDIQVSNGTASNFNKLSPRTYAVTITPEETGGVRVEVGSNVALDAGGNGNQAAEPLVIEADLTGPEVEITSEAKGPVSGAFEVTIRFSESVEGFELEDIEVSNGTASNFNKLSPRTYAVTITPEETGEVRVEVGSNVALDAGGYGNQAAEPLVIEADLERPEVTIAGPTEPVPVGMAGFEVTITFSEPVEGFEREDIQISNATVTDFTEVSSIEYRATIKPEEAGQPVMVEVPGDIAEDSAGNGNQAAEPFEVEAKLVVSYGAESYTATEGGETATVTVKLSQAGNQALTIEIRVTRPETTEVGDYTVEGLEDWDAQEGTGTLTFRADEGERTWRIAANHDGDGDDETVELGFGELPETVMTGKPAAATVTLEDKGLVELQVSFGQAAYEVKEGRQADIEVTLSPAADRRVDVPLVVALQAGTTLEDYSGVPASVVFEEGESERTISLEVLADEVNDPGEGIVLILGGLPEGVSEGEIPQTTVNFTHRRTAEQFSRSLEGMLAVIARSTAASAQTTIEGRFERHRQRSRSGTSVGEMPPPQSASANGATALRPRESERTGREGAGGGSRLRSFSLGSLGNLARSDRTQQGASPGSGWAPGGTVDGQDRLPGSGVQEAPPGSGNFSGVRDRELTLSELSFETSLGETWRNCGAGSGERETCWVPVLWGQGDLQQFNGDLTRIGMDYRGGLEAAHVGLDLYADDRMLAGLSFMRSWGDMDYTADGSDGVLESRMNTVHPYLYWQPNERVSVWGIGGFGEGQVDVEEPGRAHAFDAGFTMFAGGVRAVLSRRSNREWGLRADAFTTQLETDASNDVARVTGEAHRGRLMLEWVRDRELSEGRSLSVQAEAGGRFDDGDADRGAGAETGFRLGYLDANRGLDVALNGRVLIVHESDYRDWGVGLQASWDPGEKQRGFRASVNSSWGPHGGGRTTLWNNADAVTRPLGMGTMGIGSRYRMEGEVAYAGMKASGLPGLLTPYSRLRWAGQGRELAVGTAWSLPIGLHQAMPLKLEVETIRRENRAGQADLAVLAQISIPF